MTSSSGVAGSDAVTPDGGSPEKDLDLEQVIALLRVSEERHRLLAENANDVIWTMSLDGRITYVSPAIERVRGYTPEEAMAQTLDQIHTPDSMAVSAGYFIDLASRLEAGLPPVEFSGELEYICKDGSTIWTEVQVMPRLGPGGEVVEILGVTRDISERRRAVVELQLARDETEDVNEALKAANLELTRLATTDALTGAWNRRHFEQAAEAEVSRVNRHGQSLSLVMFDLDDFKGINDSVGHLEGDAVLAETVRRVQSHLRAEDVLTRWGGEEFLVMMPQCGMADALQVAEKLRALIASEQYGPMLTVTISIGVAEYVPGETLDDWLKRVDGALYEAKSAGRNAVRQAT